MTHKANKERMERSFEIGDWVWVYLRLVPYVQQSLVPQSLHKLSFRYFGPFQTIQKVGNVSYKLSDGTLSHSSGSACVTPQEVNQTR